MVRSIFSGKLGFGLGGDLGNDVGSEMSAHLMHISMADQAPEADNLTWQRTVPTPPDAARINTQSPFLTGYDSVTKPQAVIAFVAMATPSFSAHQHDL